ncbi:AAA family ATPase [Bifidobacterium amazonense]|uniref:AAA family ATPase n=1 Tax=Bifidobacterium amazonense TaxID=2809027 RepID=A0ABS9VYM9_9BIFI|nr:AAA family ATPase [Bifidobacterium amazonense]MCH9277217.1 AAA family ATPase [Bifidobacterium amazonense]
MRLDWLSVRNFRKFSELSVGFDPRLTVLVGSNGMGKTAVLDAAAVMLGTFLAKIPDVYGPSIQRADARRVRYVLDGVYDTQRQFPVEITARGALAFPGKEPERGDSDMVSWSRALRRADGKMTVADAHEMISLSDAYQNGVRTDPSTVLPLLGYYGTDWLWPRDRRQWKTHSDAYLQAGNRFGGYDGCLNSAVSYKQMATWFKKMTAEEDRRRTTIASYQAVRDVVSACLGMITGHDGARVDYADGGMLVSYVAPDGSVCDDEPFESLSDGYRVTVGMVADMAYRMAMLNPGLGRLAVERTPGVVLVDEVDLHLHPLWQERILSVLTGLFPKVQFIVSTHAPLVISSVGGSHVRALTFDPGTGIARAEAPSFETYGQPVSDTVTSVQGGHDLPEPVRRLLSGVEAALDDGDYDAAKDRLEELSGLVGDTNSRYVEARTAYDFLSGGGATECGREPVDA